MSGFKARARALDMLGRQQIAGIPTAISELFKNAHDAYAENVIVDYFRSDKLFVLRDDGYGMTKADFEDKWLTLGTESKVKDTVNDYLPYIPEDKKRAIMGEKGIGRLAIASIGDHVLILTRAIRKDGLHDLVMSFVYWKMFEIPRINLEQIIVPIKIIKNGNLPDENDFLELKKDIEDNINNLFKSKCISQEEVDNLISPLNNLSLIAEKIDKYLTGASLKGNGHGTHFIICPANEMLEISVDGDSNRKNSNRETPLRQALLGFSNTMLPGSSEPVIQTSFRDHKTDEYYDDIIESNEFWTPEDYLKADHHISGEFDEYGQFKGNIKVYGKEFSNHIINWKGNKGLQTQCGAFSINLAYIQGTPRESLLPPDEHTLMIAKLDKISGLYLYRDKIRILPYGDNSYDFLDLEVDRNKSNAYYFFSYRRMFGAIDITKTDNPNLTEKAGREGLRENVAYRQFVGILKNLFLQLAADFFRDSDKWGNQARPNSDYFTSIKEELNKKYLARQEFEKKSKAKKIKFQKDLDSCFNQIQDKKYEGDFERLNSRFVRDLEYCINMNDNDQAVNYFLEIEKETRRLYNFIVDSYKLQKPRGVVLSKKVQQDYNTYLREIENIQSTAFANENDHINSLFNEYEGRLNAEISRRKRLEIAIEETISQYKKSTRKEVVEIQDIAKKVSTEVVSLSKDLIKDYEQTVKKIQNELAHIEPYQLDDNKLVKERDRMENTLITEAEDIRKVIEGVRTQLENIVYSKDISQVDMVESYAEEVENLKDQLDADLELSQLGLAVSAIQHEFQHTVKVIRNQIRRLKAWADLNEGLDDIYKNFSTNFEHLDNYLTLFSPLDRRLYKKKVNIYGNDSYEFVKSVFYARISEERHNISLEATTSFSKNTFLGYPSTFYPVFVNIVDNAIFWLKDQQKPRKIVLDADKEGNMYISNNGPEIDMRDKERIFELGFTRKPSGKGMGLHISKQVLNKAGYDIITDIPRLEKGVTFKICKIKNSENA